MKRLKTFCGFVLGAATLAIASPPLALAFAQGAPFSEGANVPR